ncbi:MULTISPECIES: glycine zipper 2TM domain-containing protein [unclassified Sphingomonas]|uniref:glycine zipper 2TM domain-containing protein n=1 Tax=unclassified Sphingomonas TaxID=196159 RepID=UPI001D11FC35|nr:MULTISPECIES: glycine zipper 2TM domain-containing protein [unclassified Sphingomonas]MCC2981598.1 glycine zipper 2TM domain-containing protein [Sphingomonas sp. IC4-52]MCD2316674.1 glycine zipper 2TM domain-containing protein [Sphingomonas sp. IC-11]
MRKVALAAIGAATMVSGCMGTGYGSGYGGGGFGGGSYSAYDYNRPDPAYGGYEADRYYREGRQYRERRLSENDRVYAGRDGRYYCRRDDGTTGLIVGGIAGGVLGTALRPGGSGLLGALIGGAGGAALGQSIDKNNVRCR